MTTRGRKLGASALSIEPCSKLERFNLQPLIFHNRNWWREGDGASSLLYICGVPVVGSVGSERCIRVHRSEPVLFRLSSLVVEHSVSESNYEEHRHHDEAVT